MQPITPGIKTSEFWLTAVSNLAGAIIAILAAYGIVTDDNQELWLSLVQAVAVAVIPISLAFINGRYINSRSDIKAQALLQRKPE